MIYLFFFLTSYLPLYVCLVGATFALLEAAGAASAANCLREREATEAKGTRGEPGGKAQEDSGHERPSGLQQGHQRQPVYVY